MWEYFFCWLVSVCLVFKHAHPKISVNLQPQFYKILIIPHGLIISVSYNCGLDWLDSHYSYYHYFFFKYIFSIENSMELITNLHTMMAWMTYRLTLRRSELHIEVLCFYLRLNRNEYQPLLLYTQKTVFRDFANLIKLCDKCWILRWWHRCRPRISCCRLS